ncbi:unnamed protein product [Prunus brigantina]
MKFVTQVRDKQSSHPVMYMLINPQSSIYPTATVQQTHHIFGRKLKTASRTSLFSFSPKVPPVKQFKSFISLHIASQDEKLTFILSRSQQISKKMAFLMLWNLLIKPEKETREYVSQIRCRKGTSKQKGGAGSRIAIKA